MRSFGLLALGAVALVAGLTGALLLLGVRLPSAAVHLAGVHGILMSLGFLGTLIALERAVALGRVWGYLSPLAAGLGGLALVLGAPDEVGVALLAVAAAVFVGMYAAFERIEGTLHTRVQAVGGLAWLGAALLLLAGSGPERAFPWLAAFLVLTIAGERLELARLGQLTNRSRVGFILSAAVFGAGVVASVPAFDLGVRIAGIGLVALAAWLARNDVARRTVRMPGVTRFVAISLLAGYAWLAIGGLCWLAFGAASGAAYDAMLHAVFLGFVISMVFGHAPIILPAVLRLPLPYHPRFYAHLGLLHAGLLLRIGAGDLLGWDAARMSGGVLNVAALLTFVVSSAAAVALAPARRPAANPRSPLVDRT